MRWQRSMDLKKEREKETGQHGEPGALCMNGEIRLVDRRGQQLSPLKKGEGPVCLNWNWMLIDMRSRHPGWASGLSRWWGTEYIVDCGVHSVALKSSVPVATQSIVVPAARPEPSLHPYLNFHWVARTALMADPRATRPGGMADWCSEARGMSRFAVTTRTW